MTSAQVMEKLKNKARPDQLAGMARYGMSPEGRLGVSVPDMRQFAKELGRDHSLALELWQTGIAEARMVAAMIDDPGQLTGSQMEDWVKDFNSWDVCDQVCDNLFEYSPLAWQKIIDWSEREEEFAKRAAFTLLACLAWHDKKADDRKFIELFPVIIKGATDERNFVKKAVNWALRNIGKRNLNLNQAAVNAARQIQQIDSKAARWIAADAIRELESEAVQARLKRVRGSSPHSAS
ncbi:MAG: DNA alkylation repair protein [Chloroflexota bacterium]|nr:DNA alkylation repair protein [Chloroflexota bacterium]